MNRTIDDREQRRAQALRANLGRRKVQARGMADGADQRDDQRASASDPSDVAAPAA